MELQRIVIDQEQVENPQELFSALEELYLGVEKTYKIYVHHRNLKKLDEVFDRIISTYGLRPVNFEYSLMMSLLDD